MKTETDVVIVGTGAAGLFCALNLPRDTRIIMLTKSDLESSDSFLAQGGISVLRDEEDYDSFFEDTMRAGHYENRRESVDLMIRGSRDVIDKLVGYGVEFEHRTKDGLTETAGKEAAVGGGTEAAGDASAGGGTGIAGAKASSEEFLYTREGAHSKPRILYHKDITGKEITSRLLELAGNEAQRRGTERRITPELLDLAVYSNMELSDVFQFITISQVAPAHR